jgi:hypothetical protein
LKSTVKDGASEMNAKFKPGDKVVITDSDTSAMTLAMRSRIGEVVTIDKSVALQSSFSTRSYGYVVQEVNCGERMWSPFGFIWPEDALELVEEERYSNAELDDFFELSKEEWTNKYSADKWERMRDSMRSSFKEEFFEKALA